MDEPEPDPRDTPLLSIVLYVLGFMAALGILAFLAAWILRRV